MTDKYQSGIIRFYEEFFKDLKNKPIKLLELGILRGDSLRYFREYFPNGEIMGIDWKLPAEIEGVKMIQGKQEDIGFLLEIGNKISPLDIIIDDCSHYGTYTKISFDFLFKHLKSGGYYIIEDWGASFRSGEFSGNEKVISNIIENFDRLKLKEVRAIKLHEGGWIAIIEKL